MRTNLSHVPPFHAPGWCFNGHVHTIGRSLVGDTNLTSIDRIEIPTPDDDFLELDCAIQPGSDSIIVLFHGLEGSTQRYYMIELMKVLLREGHSVIGVNFRSCGSRMNRQARFYHSGETKDYITTLNWVANKYPNKNVGVVGFSLGGNALIKYLAENPEDSPVSAAVAVSVPYELRLGSIILSKGFHRVYQYYFLRTLKEKLNIKRNRYPELPKFSGSTLFEFDDQITAPIHGFDGANNYYKQCSARRFVQDIATHTLLLHSHTDPMCPIQTMPLAKISENPYTDYIITDYGGHVGFWSRPKGWLNFVIENYLSSNM